MLSRAVDSVRARRVFVASSVLQGGGASTRRLGQRRSTRGGGFAPVLRHDERFIRANVQTAFGCDFKHVSNGADDGILGALRVVRVLWPLWRRGASFFAAVRRVHRADAKARRRVPPRALEVDSTRRRSRLSRRERAREGNLKQIVARGDDVESLLLLLSIQAGHRRSIRAEIFCVNDRLARARGSVHVL